MDIAILILRLVSAYVVTIIFTVVLFLLGAYLSSLSGPSSSEAGRHFVAITVTVIPVFLAVLSGVYVIPSRMRRIGSWILLLSVCITYCLFWFYQVKPYGDPANPVLPMLPDIAIAGTVAALFYQRRRPSKSSRPGDAFE